MKLAIVGAGQVGQTLSGALQRAGHTVVFGVRTPGDAKHAALHVLDVRAAVEVSEAVVLATPWATTEAAVRSCGDLGGRPLLDATNPLTAQGLQLGHHDSGGEAVARWATNAKVVKVFNTTGLENMANPRYGGTRADLFLCGDDRGACEVASTLAKDLGFRPIAIGPLTQARLLEPLAHLWITLALGLKNGRDIAFHVLTREHAP